MFHRIVLDYFYDSQCWTVQILYLLKYEYGYIWANEPYWTELLPGFEISKGFKQGLEIH